MAEDTEEVHRVSVSIQYSDYSSADDVYVPPEATPSQSKDNKPTDNEDTDNDDDDSLSSTTSSDSEVAPVLNRQHTRKRTTKLIESKMHEITAKLTQNHSLEDALALDIKQKEEEEKEKQQERQIVQSRSRMVSTTEKKATLASRWQQMVESNSIQKQLHPSQASSSKRFGRIHENGSKWNGIQTKPKSKETTNKLYKELTPQQLWKKRKEEREKALRSNTKQIQSENMRKEQEERIMRQKEEERKVRKRIEAQRLQKQKKEEDDLEKLRIETEQMQFEIDQLHKLKEKEQLKQIETEELEKERLQKEFETEKERLKQIETERLKQQKAAEALKNERKLLREQEERRRAESLEEKRLHNIQKEEKRRRKQEILNRKRERMKEIERTKKEEEEDVDMDALMENVYNHFIYDDGYILNGQTILLYLKQSLRIHINKEEVLRDALIDLYGSEVISTWGYYLRLL